jgi:hypothetical protein
MLRAATENSVSGSRIADAWTMAEAAVTGSAAVALA